MADSAPQDAGSDPHRPAVEQAIGWLQDHLLHHAELSLVQVLAQAPRHWLALRLHGIALWKLGRREEALDEIATATENDPASAGAWADLAVALRDSGRVAESEAAFARAVQCAAPGRPTPPLDDLAFVTDRAYRSFTVVDYEYNARIRYGSGLPPHPELAAIVGAGRHRYLAQMGRWADLPRDFADVRRGGAYDSVGPFWLNGWFPPLDALALTGMLREHAPRRLVEIGSGVSTKFARRAVARYGLTTRITSVDPTPRNDIDGLCDEVVRQPLETCDAALFQALEPGDIFFLDSSHRSFQGSDVTVFFLEILPRLKPGVIVHIHDIYLPDDYIAGHVKRLWNEQYLLAAALLFGADRFEILFPSWFVGRDRELRARADASLSHRPTAELDLYGASFWFRLR